MASSSNPFRRNGPSSSSVPSSSLDETRPFEPATSPLPETTNIQRIDAPKKIAKKVRVQSPPPISPAPSSLSGSEYFTSDEIYTKPQTLIHNRGPFDGLSQDASQPDGLVKPLQPSRPLQAPPNPFSRTLETMEHPERGTVATNVATKGARQSMDVEAFKRMLMTGNAGVGGSEPPGLQTPGDSVVGQGRGSTGSITKTPVPNGYSETEDRRQSESLSDGLPVALQDNRDEFHRAFPPIEEDEFESPHISNDTLSSGLEGPSFRKAPPPPSSRHGKLIKVELRDDDPPTPDTSSQSPYLAAGSHSDSNSDLNKPLPPAPRRSLDSDRDPGAVSLPPSKTSSSPTSSVRQKDKSRAPPPPVTRRQSALYSNNTSQGSKIASSSSITDRERSPERKADPKPPPPPTRRTSVRGSSSHTNEIAPPTPPPRVLHRTTSGRPVSVISFDASKEPPPTPPTRGTNRTTSSSSRPASLRSVESKRSSMAVPPPPPPPRGHGRSSFDNEGSLEEHNGEATQSVDVLADLTRLQREIDALRIQSEEQR